MFAKKQIMKGGETSSSSNEEDKSIEKTHKESDTSHGSNFESIPMLSKSGYLWKKQSKSFYSAWDRRFVVLDGTRLVFYEDEKRK